ncbi:zinc finger protein, putative [Ricinus communis]|uniref:Zinc finger protein, putative n=1 Tax=Ricinus communis TaxID=3988 RepID=B9RWB9_RICCO|nr:zinc finger protein, putative [Ricinus communis]
MMDIVQRWRILIITLLVVLSNTNSRNGVVESAKVPAMFVFGDSLVDNGNNNWLRSIAKANYYPYGIDFNIGSTGRFSNGKTFVDILGEMVSAPYPSAFTDPATAGARILGGVNYASAAAGILDETGQHYGERYSLSQQVLNFESSLNELRRMMNGTNLTEFLGKSLAVLVFGSNDYINNYLMPSIYSSSYIYSPPQFANLLLNHYARQLYAMYSTGLRKFLIAGVGPLGCIPNQRGTGQSPPDRCVDYVNQMLGSFNEGLKSLGCCGIGRNQGEVTCLPFVVPCANRNVYVFWDAFHPTQAVNSILAHRAFSGPPTDCYPINVQQMTLFY